jgi:hypothetical protein
MLDLGFQIISLMFKVWFKTVELVVVVESAGFRDIQVEVEVLHIVSVEIYNIDEEHKHL